MDEEMKREWIEEQSEFLKLVSPEIIPLSPTFGFFFKVNNVEIPQEIFKEEFDIISKAYFSVIDKINSQDKRD